MADETFDQLYPMREEMARQNQASDHIKKNSEKVLPSSPVKSTQVQSKFPENASQAQTYDKSQERDLYKQFIANLACQEEIQNKKMKKRSQEETAEREQRIKIINQEWQERRKPSASEEFDYQKWKNEQKMKEQKRDDFNLKYTEYNKQVSQAYKERPSLSASSSPQKKTARLSLMKKTVVEKMIEISKLENVPLYRISSEKIMDFICKELGTNLQKIPVHIKSDLHQSVKYFQKKVKEIANNSTIKRRASLLINSSWCDAEYCVPPSLLEFASQSLISNFNTKEDTPTLHQQLQIEDLDPEEQSNPMIHNKELGSPSSMFAKSKIYNFNDHATESQWSINSTDPDFSVCPAISNLELCNLMKNSGHPFGDLVNQQKTIRKHILARLGLTEETIDYISSIDLNMEVEKFTVTISRQYQKSSRTFERLLKKFDKSLNQNFHIPRSVSDFQNSAQSTDPILTSTEVGINLGARPKKIFLRNQEEKTKSCDEIVANYDPKAIFLAASKSADNEGRKNFSKLIKELDTQTDITAKKALNALSDKKKNSRPSKSFDEKSKRA